MNSISNNNIVFVDLKTVTDVFIWDHQLTAPIIGAVDGYNVGDYVIALSGEKVVGAGRISDRYFVQMYEGGGMRITKRFMRMNITPAPRPELLSEQQQRVLRAAALEHGCKFPGLTCVLGIRPGNEDCFASLLGRMRGCIKSIGSSMEQWQSAKTLETMARADISDEMKVDLCEALAGQGKLGDAVFDRDFDRIDSDHDLDLAATRIVPWEVCSDDERLDPDNYVLIDSQLAEHFAAGLISFRDSGNQFHDTAMAEEAFDPWVDPEFQLPSLNAQQKKYMAYHRKYVYKQWRTNAQKPVYLANQ